MVDAMRGGLPTSTPTQKTNRQELPDSDWEEEDAICVVCGGGEATDENDIAVCDRCLCPFHQQCCHPPVTAKELGEEEDEWWCRRCDLVYDHLSNAVLDACGVDEQRQRTFKKVQSLLETDGEGGGWGSSSEEEKSSSEEGEEEEEARPKGKPSKKPAAKPSKGKGSKKGAAAAAVEEDDSGAYSCVYVWYVWVWPGDHGVSLL